MAAASPMPASRVRGSAVHGRPGVQMRLSPLSSLSLSVVDARSQRQACPNAHVLVVPVSAYARMAGLGTDGPCLVAVGTMLEFRFDAVFDETDVRWLNTVRARLEALVTEEVFQRATLREHSLEMKRMYVPPCQAPLPSSASAHPRRPVTHPCRSSRTPAPLAQTIAVPSKDGVCPLAWR
jgi:hypothetical protein